MAFYQSSPVNNSADVAIESIRKSLGTKHFERVKHEGLYATKSVCNSAVLDERQAEFARALITVGEYTEAVKLLTKPSASSALNVDKFVLLAQADIGRARYGNAVRNLLLAESALPEQSTMRTEIQFELGKAYLGLGDFRAASSAFKQLKCHGGNTKCAEMYLTLVDSQNGASPHVAETLVKDLLSFWSEFELEAIPNLDFVACQFRRCGDFSSSEVVQRKVQELKRS